MPGPGIARVGVDTAGGTQLGGGQSFVRINGNLIVLLGDSVDAHAPCPDVPVHCLPVMATSSSLTRINGTYICRQGDTASCGHASTGASWVTSL